MINPSMKTGISLLMAVALVLGFRNYGINREISAKTFAYKSDQEKVYSKRSCSSDDIKQLIDLESIEITGIAISEEEDGISLIHIRYTGTPMDAKAAFNELGEKENLKALSNIVIQNEGEHIKIEADIEYFANNICK